MRLQQLVSIAAFLALGASALPGTFSGTSFSIPHFV